MQYLSKSHLTKRDILKLTINLLKIGNAQRNSLFRFH